MTAEITKRVPSTSVQGYFPHDFFILHIGHEHSLCCRFIRFLEQEGYKCCSNAETKLCNIGKKRAGGLCDLIMKSENYIIWISSENDPDTDWLLLCEKFARNTSFRRHGYYLPYIFRLYGCQVPEKFRKYGTYELLPDFPSKIPEIIEYLKRVPTQEFSSKYKDTWIKYDAYLVVSDSRCTDFLGPFVEALEGNGCTVYCKLRYMRVGSRIHHEVTRNMKMSQSLIIIFDNTFFDNNWTSFKIDLGLHMKEMFEKTFKFIVLEVTPIPDEDLFHFRLFSRITLKKGYEKTAYTHVLKILNNTGRWNSFLNAGENRSVRDHNKQIVFARMVNQQPPQKLFSESRKDINLYKSLVETQSVEMYYIHVRLVVLGQEGVCKTTLVKKAHLK